MKVDFVGFFSVVGFSERINLLGGKSQVMWSARDSGIGKYRILAVLSNLRVDVSNCTYVPIIALQLLRL